MAQDPGREVNMQDIRLIAGEGQLTQTTMLQAFNVILKQRVQEARNLGYEAAARPQREAEERARRSMGDYSSPGVQF